MKRFALSLALIAGFLVVGASSAFAGGFGYGSYGYGHSYGYQPTIVVPSYRVNYYQPSYVYPSFHNSHCW